VFNSLMNRRNALDQRSKGPAPKTALGIALEQGQVNMAIHLLERGASPVLPQQYGSALLRAVDLESSALVRVLAKKGFDMDDVDAVGDTALIKAVKRQQPEMVQTLLALKADPNTANATTGATALMLAAGQGHTAMVRLLFEAKADPQLRDRQQRTARDYLPQNAEDALQALFKPQQKRRPAVPASATKAQSAKDPLSKITGRYVLPKGSQQGYLSISAIQKNIITFALHTFDGSECHLEDRQMKLFYSKTYGSYWGKYTAEGCTLNFTYYWNKARKRWIFDIKSSGSCDRLCSPGGRIAGRYVKDAS
jgi:hypothetical protein